MRSKLLGAIALLVFSLTAQEWKLALPGYPYEFPRDHFNHPGYQTEWWYYTGNLHSPDGHRFGFELTFFRQAIHLTSRQAAASDAAWRPDQIYFAHLALSDIDGGEFYHTERLNRAGPGLAGASLQQQRYWNGNWQVRWTNLGTGDQQLQAVCDRFTLKLNLRPEKAPVINGLNGISQKGPLPGEASHYISFTRLNAAGLLEWKNARASVNGPAWMDHEFFTEPRDNTLIGWDWFAIQLNNNEELMLYRLRRSAGGPGAYSSGTYVDSHGKARFLSASEFSLLPDELWHSPHSNARYPISWHISVPCLGLELTERTALKNQELFGDSRISPSYWEGAVTYQGRMRSQPVTGLGYLEMTGYAKPVNLGG
jgi:predicted secreted hydrolase